MLPREVSTEAHTPTAVHAKAPSVPALVVADPSPTEPPLARPAARIAAVAASASPQAAARFEPSAAHRALAGALILDAGTFAELAASAGVSRARLYEILDDPAACAWIVTNTECAVKSALGAVYARLLDRALTSEKPAWMRLLLERFDDSFLKTTAPNAVHNTLNVFNSMSESELKSFVEQRSRQLLGS